MNFCEGQYWLQRPATCEEGVNTLYLQYMNMCVNKEYNAGHTENYDKIKLTTNMHQEAEFDLPSIFI